MPGGLVQRVPVGLLNILGSVTSGENPRILADDVQACLELIQFYGLTQRTILTAANAALAEGTNVGIALPVATWSVLFGVEFNVVKTATLTALRGSISLVRGTSGASIGVYSEELGPFGATETGTARMMWWAPYPLLMPPGSSILARPDIVGTDANVNAAVLCEIGILG